MDDKKKKFTLPLFLQLVVVRADLNGHLKALKDYFLLEKGDFFQVKTIKYMLVLCSNKSHYIASASTKTCGYVTGHIS